MKKNIKDIDYSNIKIIEKFIDINEVSVYMEIVINKSKHTIEGYYHTGDGYESLTIDGEDLFTGCEENGYDYDKLKDFIVDTVIGEIYPPKKHAKGGKVLSEDELWDIIESYKWDGSKYRDYERIGKKVSKLSKDKYKQVYGFARAKQRLLRKKFDKVWLSDDFPYTGDDSWTDLRAEIVGRGKKFYNNMNSKKLREMAENQDYNENFLYSFHHHKGFNDFGSSDDLMDYVEKWYAKGGMFSGIKEGKKVEIADYYIDDEVGQRAKATPTAIILSEPSDDEELVMVQYTNGSIDYVPQDVIEVLPFAKGGKVKKKGTEMIMGGLAGVLLGIFLNK